MFKKSFFGVCICVTVVIGIMAFCNKSNPAAPKPVDITGTWTGIFDTQNMGALHPDTFSAVLTITGTGYTLYRGRTFYGSSGSLSDSSREVGTWAKLGTDSVVLSPHMSVTDSTQDSCFYYGNTGVWRQCDGSLAAQFCTCQPPIHIKIDITGNVWHNVVIPRYDDINQFAVYNLTKQ